MSERMIKMNKVISVILFAIILFSTFLNVSAENFSSSYTDNTAAGDSSYASYLENNTCENGTDALTITPVKNEGNTVEFEAEVTPGTYNIFLNYKVESVRTDAIDYSLKIDGAYPFSDCYTLSLPVYYTEEGESFKKDSKGNELPGDLLVSENEIKNPVCDDEGIYKGGFLFYLSEDRHIITVEITDGEIDLISLNIQPPEEIPDYDEYISADSRAGNNNIISLDAERPDYRTSKSILAFCDASSASAEPAADKNTVLNSLGGSQWSVFGQKAEWKINVKESGWYKLAVKYMQSYTNGRSVSRSLYIDGKLPFSEAENISFPYSGKWKEMVFSGKEGAYLFYLEKGEHTISLAVSLGEMSDIIKESRIILSRINAVYRKIITLTGVSPDSFRDYQLDEKIPDTIKQMGELSKSLYDITNKLSEIESSGTESGALKRLALQLKRFNEDPEKIAVQLTQFQSNISAFGTWLNDRFSQPLAIDEIAFCGEDAESPFKFANIFASIAHGFKQFIYSFTTDYGSIIAENDIVEVWAPTGRDQMQIIKNLINQMFIPETGISVNLKLISEAALLPAVVAGEGPDVALMCQQATPINFAMRNAVEDLSKYDGFNEVCSQMIKNSLIPFTYEGGVYAIPETLTFPILFYRTDIISELGIKVPRTWNDVTEIIVDLSHNNMQFGFSASLQNYATMLYQNGGKVYKTDSTASAFDENEAVKAFEKYTSLYRYFKIPVTFEFANRFRNGQMPIAVAEYTAYNTLKIFASEIDGLWSIAPVPGTEAEDGTVNSTVVGTVTGCIMIKDTNNKEAAWKFIKWWTSGDIQELYGTKVEEKLGASARYPTANAVALEHLPWSYEFYSELSKQIENVTCIPEIPGGYFTSRHFNNAFRKVVYKSENPRETLLEYTKEINSEITGKRNEFGLITGGKSE